MGIQAGWVYGWVYREGNTGYPASTLESGGDDSGAGPGSPIGAGVGGHPCSARRLFPDPPCGPAPCGRWSGAGSPGNTRLWANIGEIPVNNQ